MYSNAKKTPAQKASTPATVAPRAKAAVSPAPRAPVAPTPPQATGSKAPTMPFVLKEKPQGAEKWTVLGFVNFRADFSGGMATLFGPDGEKLEKVVVFVHEPKEKAEAPAGKVPMLHFVLKTKAEGAEKWTVHGYLNVREDRSGGVATLIGPRGERAEGIAIFPYEPKEKAAAA